MRNELPIRKNIRLQGYDYSQAGYYFVTICVKDKHELLWDDVGANSVRPPFNLTLSDAGKVMEYAINQIPIHYPMVRVDKYVVMPNHIHMILIIDMIDNGNVDGSGKDSNSVKGSGRTLFALTASCIVKQCKEYVTKQIGYSIWQKSYHDHIIRNEDEYKKIWQYIDENPIRWTEDCYYVGL